MDKTPINAPEGFAWIESATSHTVADAEVVFSLAASDAAAARLILRVEREDVWRVRFEPEGAESPPATGMLVDPLDAPLAPEIREEEDAIIVASGRIEARVRKDPFSLAFLDESGFDVLRDNPNDVDGLGQPFTLPLGYVKREGRIVETTQSFHLRQDEAIYGLGEKFTPLDKNGQTIVSWTRDAFGSTSERSHKNVPFFYSDRGYGFFLHSSARATFEMGTVSRQSHTARVEAPSFEYFAIFADDPATILREYARLTGFAPVPPRWTFGLWISSGGTYRDQAAMEKLIAGFEEDDVPHDVVHVDPWWMRWRKYCDFEWNRDAFPDPKKFIEDLHRRGLKLCLWEHSYISVESELYDYGKERGYFAKTPDGEPYIIDYGLSLAPRPDGVIRVATPETSWNARVAIIDLTNDEAYRWFQELHRPVLEMGADVFKTDFGEDVPEDAVFANGKTGAEMHNLYPFLYNQAVYEATREVRGEAAVWARSGTAGNQRYPIHWSGDPGADFDNLACTIRGGLSFGQSGFPFWSHDIGGYRGTPTPHLYIRWAQFGLLSSHSRMHADSPREPRHFGERAVEIVREFVKLRYRLFPYLYSASIEASKTGMPVLRAMPLAYPGDLNARGKDLQYMLGSRLLVAPIYDEGFARSVYLPEGSWLDFWTREKYEGGRNYVVEAPLERIPIFVKAGAVLPTMKPSNRIPVAPVDPLVLEIYPGGEDAFRYYDDDGEFLFRTERKGDETSFVTDGKFTRAITLRYMGKSDAFDVELAPKK